jgi:hypothetical protein
LDPGCTSPEQLAALKAAGRKPFAYISFGNIEDYRDDFSLFPTSVFSATSTGWPGSHWLDISQLETEPKIKQIMEARIARVAAMGFIGIIADGVDSYTCDVATVSGRPITGDEQLRYNIWIANTIHAHNLLAGLNNDGLHYDTLVNYYDLAEVEECTRWQECALPAAFTRVGKMAIAIEYEVDKSICAEAKANGITVVFKNLMLNALPYESCS